MNKFIKPNYNEVKINKKNSFDTQFEVSPLERGFANTVGNALRRVLLSSVNGVAPFAIRVAGVAHEFQTIKDVKEDVVSLILNLKNIRFKHKLNSIAPTDFLTIRVEGKKGKVKAGDLELPPQLEVVNPELEIATLNKDKALNLEIFVRGGKGFVSFEENKLFLNGVKTELSSKLKSGELIAIDSNYTPIEKVSYDIRELNTSSPTIEEKLTLNVKTDGSVEAKEALSQAAKILIGHLEIIQNVDENLDASQIWSEETKQNTKQNEVNMSISDLNLSVRSYNSLKKVGIESVNELKLKNKSEIASIQNLGKKSLDEILDKLKEIGIVIKGTGE
ncbi:MAG: DNA-directed RNA polymerase subunit alpha [Mycoplasma sp.]|nr:DNA-directed RNA polymerase subunit alpha [Mycoplasma sp.]